MTDTEVEEAPDVQAADAEDTTELELRSWGLTGQPASWALSSWVTTIEVIRQANAGLVPLSAVQAVLDASFPDRGYLAENVALAHAPVGHFIHDDDGSDVRFDLDGDEDLGLPDECVEWDFGDGNTYRDAGGWDHTYEAHGTYEARVTVMVAGVAYTSTQMVEVGGDVAPVLTLLEPGTAAVGGQDFTLRVHGSGFTDESVIVWNDGDEPTVFESEVVVTTIVKPSMVGAPVDLPVHVRNGEELSNALGFSFTGSEPPPEAPPEEEDEEDWNPADYTVDEVLTYAAEHPDEVDAIRAAEESGKGRVGILDKL